MTARDPRERFSERVADYVQWRPSYPGAAVDETLAGLGDPHVLTVVDVGAGTGTFSRLVADRGPRVIAIEPNEAMRSGAAPHANVEWRAGSAEETHIAPNSTDLVTAAQAFHWFDKQRALDEFARILKPRGRVALIWNQRDDSDPFTREYGDAIRAVASGDAAVDGMVDASALASHRSFSNYRERSHPSAQSLTLDGVFGRARSASYVPKEGPGWDALESSLRASFARLSGDDAQVSLRYRTRVFLAERSP